MFFREEPYRYTIENEVFSSYDMDDYEEYSLFSYTKLSQEEFIKIISDACAMILSLNKLFDKDWNDNLIYNVYTYLLEYDDRFFNINRTQGVVINTISCKKDYEVETTRNCCLN